MSSDDIDIQAVRDGELHDADLHDANLQDAQLPNYQRLPDTGSFDAYKGCKGHVVRLRVPADADRVSSLVGPKCRVEFAEVAEVLDANAEQCDDTEAFSKHDDEFTYREGEIVEPDDWDDDIRVQCTHGIHVYPTISEAVDACPEADRDE